MPMISGMAAVIWFSGLEKSTWLVSQMRTPRMPTRPYSTTVAPPSTPGGIAEIERIVVPRCRGMAEVVVVSLPEAPRAAPDALPAGGEGQPAVVTGQVAEVSHPAMLPQQDPNELCEAERTMGRFWESRRR